MYDLRARDSVGDLRASDLRLGAEERRVGKVGGREGGVIGVAQATGKVQTISFCHNTFRLRPSHDQSRPIYPTIVTMSSRGQKGRGYLTKKIRPRKMT